VWGILPEDLRDFKKVKLLPEGKSIKIKTTRLNSVLSKKDFSINTYLSGKVDLNTSNIFELHQNWNNVMDQTKEMC
jgi:hypothetical protein